MVAGRSRADLIAAAGLSPGYWRDKARMEAAVTPDPRPGRER